MTWLLALVPAAIVALSSLFVKTFAGDYEALGAAYGPLLNAGVLLRTFGMFASVLLVWGLLRSRGAGRAALGLAILSGPITYGIIAAAGALIAFPPGQAAYYGVNPIFLASIGGQCAAAGLAEGLWRWRARRRGVQTAAPVSPGLVGVVVGGLALVFFTVIFQGGVPFFYVYQRGYLLLFT